MPNDQDYIDTETPNVDEMLPEEPVADDVGEEEKPSVGERVDDAKEKYDKAKDWRDRYREWKNRKTPQAETAKQGAPEAEGGKAAGNKAPSELKGKIGKPLPKGVPGGGIAGEAAGGVGEAAGAAEGIGAATGGAGAAAGTAGGAAGAAGTASAVAGGAGTAGTAGAAGATLWWVVLIIVIVLIIIAFVLFLVGFVVGLSTGGQGGADNQSGGGSQSSTSDNSVTDTSFIPVEGKYFPISVKPSAGFEKGTGRGFGDSREGGARHHAGNDLLAPRGTSVRAVADGTVVNYYYFYQCSGGASYALIVDHGDFVVNYGEVEAGLVGGIGVGSKVSAGQVIAKTDGCGMLHFEMYTPGTTTNSSWRGSKPSNLLDPNSFLNKLLAGFK